MMRKLLIANRGEIACRVIRTARRLGIATVAVYSDVDAQALHVEMADEACRIGPAPARDSYLAIDEIIDVARRSGTQAVHPGYGFLSENPSFAERCLDAGLIFVGPPAKAMRAMGSKAQAKALMERAGMPVAPGLHTEAADRAALRDAAQSMGPPVVVKASAGGGGRGMRVVRDMDEFDAAVESAAREAQAAFGDDRLFVEKYLERARHIEIQIFADAQGACVSFPERDCSMQRRHQKIMEETPAPDLAPQLARAMREAAVAAAKAVGYVGAGTIEFLVEEQRFYFLEMNTRLQVEHPITEMIARQDLVEWQLRIACGEPLPLRQDELVMRGAAVEARICAEDPARDFLPAIGVVEHFRTPRESEAIRLDTGMRQGDRITPYYDSLLAKLVAWGEDRASALRRLRQALSKVELVGVATNLDFLRVLSESDALEKGEYDTTYVERNLSALGQAEESEAADELVVLAAGVAAWLEEQRRRAAASDDALSLWASTDAWRLDTPGVVRVDFAFAGRIVGARVFLAARGFRLEALSRSAFVEAHERDGRLRLSIDGARREAGVVRRGRETTVIMQGRNYILREVDPHASAGDRAGADNELRAPLPARVSRVLAEAGAKVGKHAPLFVLEVMKTEFTLTAPRHGVVVNLRCKEGDFVAEGAVLAELVDPK